MSVSSIVVVNGNRASTVFFVTALVLENGIVTTVSDDTFSVYSEAFAFAEEVKKIIEEELTKHEVNSKYNFLIGGL